MTKPKIITMTKDYCDYLRDESRKVGKAATISFPQSEEEIINTIKLFSARNEKITIQGARTGITAGAVPDGGHILNLEKMDKITGLRCENGKFILSVQPGVKLIDLRKAISKKNFDTSQWSVKSIETLEKMKKAGDFFFPPDPTETTASIGGMVACNASGARSFYYGSTRKYVQGLSIILSDGTKLRITRNNQKADGYFFTLETDTGRIIKSEVPKYQMPKVKNASGYFACKDMDLIDLFIGSEGTLGVITEIDILLIKKPRYTWGGLFFFNNEDDAIDFVNCLRGDMNYLRSDIFHNSAAAEATNACNNSTNACNKSAATYEISAASQQKDFQKESFESYIDLSYAHVNSNSSFKLVAIEYFDSNSLELLRKQKRDSGSFTKIPDIKPEYNTAIYVEFDDDCEEAIADSMIEAAKRAQLCNGKEEDNWIAHTPQLMEQMKFFRHAVPEAVNSIIDQRRKIDPGITKLGTDMAVPDDKLKEVIRMYRSDLEKNNFEFVMFGHIGNNHIHVNILPRSMEEYIRGKELYRKWAEKILSEGGTISAEHGIGKLKNEFLELMYGSAGMEEMLKVKKALEPKFILNQGNLFNV
ncbi:MAG TPA: FAD-binding oxidoreductase [Clostridiaceae bacterium]|nr:FAD-binding oxidoreductase [Clostridiaceae bacterium]